MKRLLAFFLLIFLSFANYGHGHCPGLHGKNKNPHNSASNHLGSLYVTEKDPRQIRNTPPNRSILALACGPKKLQNLLMDKNRHSLIPDLGKGAKGTLPLGEVPLMERDMSPPRGSVMDGQDIYLLNENVVRNLQLTTGP
jgi:hypothetical protein